MSLIAQATAVLSLVGLVQARAGLSALKAFNRRARPAGMALPPVSVLKPLKGDEPLLEAALASFCTQSYPDYQIVFGVQDVLDPAITVVERLRRLFPERDITLVVDETEHVGNRKIANLVNMWPAAKHDIIVLADSDVHVTPHFLERVVAALAEPGVGAVTALYAGVPGSTSPAGRFGAAQINHIFLSGVLVGRMLGRQDCLGAAIAVKREMLGAIGGFAALLPYLADDAALGHLVRRQGGKVSLATNLVVTTVGEQRFVDLFRHELRWARTIRALEPVTYATTVLQLPIFWALLTLLCAGLALWAVGFVAIVWALRALIARGMARQLGRGEFSGWLLPFREGLTLAVLLASYFGNQVEWRGVRMAAADDRRQLKARAALRASGKPGLGKLGFFRTGFFKTGRFSRGINQL